MHPILLKVPFPEFTLFSFHLGPTVTLHTYGVLLAIAFLAGLWAASRQAKRDGLDAGRVTDMAVWVLIAGLVGAKALLLAVDWRYFSRNPRELLSLFQSGGVFYGGLLAGHPGGLALRAPLPASGLADGRRAGARRRDRPGDRAARLLLGRLLLGQARPGALGGHLHGRLRGAGQSARRWTRRCTRASSTSPSPPS